MALIFILSGCASLFALVTENALRGVAIIASMEFVEYAYDKGVENRQGHEIDLIDDEGSE